MKNSNQIKQIEKVETIPQLSEKVISTEHSKLLPAYYVLREAFKDKPYVKLSIAKDYIAHYLNVSTKTAYAYIETDCLFWTILPKRKRLNKQIKITPFSHLCAALQIYPVRKILLPATKYFNGSIALRKASLFQNSVAKRGSIKTKDIRGVFGRNWVKQKNGKMKPMSSSVGETILQRDYNYPVCRETIERRTNVPKSTQINYGKTLRCNHTTFQTFFNFNLCKELTKDEFIAIKSGKCDLDLLDKIMSITNFQALGTKFKARKLNELFFLTEQLANSYQDFVESVSKNKTRKLNSKIKKLIVNNDKILYSKKINNFCFGPRYTDDGFYYEGAQTLRPNIKQAFWIKIENGKREIFSKPLHFKDYVYKDLKQYLHHSNNSTTSFIDIASTATA